MGSGKLFNQYQKEIKTLFNSGINIKILFHLYNNPGSVSEISSATGSGKSPVFQKIKFLVESGFIDSDNGIYSLTTIGRIIAGKIAYITEDFCKNIYPDITPEIIAEYKDNKPVFILNGSKAFDTVLEDIQTVFRSAYSVNMLFSLKDGRINRDELKEALGIKGAKTSTYTSKINWLISRGIIIEDVYDYYLKPGYEDKPLIIEEFIKTLLVLFKHGHYLNSHIIEDLPQFALENIGDLINTHYVCDTPDEPFKNFENWMQIISESEYMYSISNYATSGVLDPIGKKLCKDSKLNVIVNRDVASKIFEEPFIKYTKYMSKRDNVKFMVADFPETLGMTVTDKCFTIKFSGTDGAFDTSRGLVSRSDEAKKWGMALYDYYKKDAVHVLDYIKNSGIDIPDLEK